MKTFLIICLISCTHLSHIFAQQKYTTFRLDTINVKGIVYDNLGKPASGVLLFVKGKRFPLPVRTNNEGEFELKGASVKDTIAVDFLFGSVIIKNNGSRYLEINLPPDNIHDLTYNRIEINTKRKYPKNPTPEIKTLIEGGIWDYGGKLAYFPGGDYKFEALIKENVVYPEKAIANNIEGEVKIGFVINKEGLPMDFKILRGIGYDCEEQVIDAIKKSPKWIPGIFSGKVVSTPSSITINFKLTDK